MRSSIDAGILAVFMGGLFLSTLATSVAADEPSWQAAPLYETVDLTSGFSNDPYEVSVKAGGGDAVSSGLAPECIGNINAERPDVDLNYEAGNFPLFITVDSADDTTLVVFGPEGRWYCNDDFGSLDPMVVFQNPESGNYNIWVGVHSGNDTPDATLSFTEINPM